MFCFIFYSCVGVSGGDIAICAFNVIFGFFQIIMILIVYRKKEFKVQSAIVVAVIIAQIIELLFFLKFGYAVNEFIKSI